MQLTKRRELFMQLAAHDTVEDADPFFQVEMWDSSGEFVRDSSRIFYCLPAALGYINSAMKGDYTFTRYSAPDYIVLYYGYKDGKDHDVMVTVVEEFNLNSSRN